MADVLLSHLKVRYLLIPVPSTIFVNGTCTNYYFLIRLLLVPVPPEESAALISSVNSGFVGLGSVSDEDEDDPSSSSLKGEAVTISLLPMIWSYLLVALLRAMAAVWSLSFSFLTGSSAQTASARMAPRKSPATFMVPAVVSEVSAMRDLYVFFLTLLFLQS